jgi:carbon-monoxide dehydrogenase catalytic subunit
VNKIKKQPKLVFERFKDQQPQCNFGISGICCKNCFMGPCRIIPKKQERGVCGATAETIVSRNLLRTVTAGATCHSDHAREIVLSLLKIAEKKANYQIKDKEKLKKIAKRLRIKSNNPNQIAKLVSLEAIEDFRRQEGLYHKKEGYYLNWLGIKANKERIQTWKKLDILPINADLESSHVLHQTTMGNDADYKHLLLSTLKMGLVDGYAGLHLATDLQDIIFGTPTIVKTETNLGVLKKDYINIIVHGHVPLLSEKIIEASKQLESKAKKIGARGINVIGMCCTGIETLMRLGIPTAGHVLQQELAITTGLVDAVVVDIQCIYPSLSDIASCYHTKLITTIDYVRIPNSIHIPFTVENAEKSAKKIVNISIESYKKRNPAKINPINKKSKVYAGFSAEAIIKALSNTSKNPSKYLYSQIKKGNLFGIVAIIGCRNPKAPDFHEKLTKLLIKNNILVIGTGCWAYVASQSGLMTPEAHYFAGKKLKKFLKEVGQKNNFNYLPPCLHMGGCVDNSRIETLLQFLSKSLNLPFPKLPVIASAPEYTTEKATAIATWILDLGITTHINPPPPITGSKKVLNFLTKDLEKVIGSKVLIATKPRKASKIIIKEIKKKREYIK